MQFLMLIYKNEEKLAAASQNEQAALGQKYGAFNSFLAESGALLGTATWPSNVRTVEVRDGETRTVDGEHAESDGPAGFFLIDVESADEAVRFAERVPDALYGAVEIRPVQQGR